MKAEYVQKGNTQFNVSQVKKMTFSSFKKAFAGKLRGYDITKAAKELGIKVPKIDK